MVVTATRQASPVSELLADVSVIEREELDKAGHSTLAQVLSRQAGVEMADNGSPGSPVNIYLRGASEKQMVVLLDGVRVGSASKSAMESWSRIPLAMIERVEVLRGPASALYGSEAVGGVIQLFTRRGEGGAKVFAEGGLGSYDTQMLSGGVSGAVDGLRYAFGVSSMRTDGISSYRRGTSGYNPDSDGFRDYSMHASLDYKVRPGTEVGTSLFYSDGVHAYDSTTASADYRARLAVGSAEGHVRHQMTDRWTTSLRLGRSVDDSSSFRNQALSSLFRTDQVQYQWQNDVDVGFGRLLAGLEHLGQRVSGNTGYPAGKGERAIESAFVGWSASHGAHRFQANGRHDANSQFGHSNTGALAYGYQLTRAWRANVSYGTAFRAPSLNELYGPSQFGFVANPNLVPEHARNKEAAVHYEVPGLHLSLTLFDNRIKDMIPSGAVTMNNIGHAALTGGTFAYEGRLGSFDAGGSFTHNDPRDEDSGRQLRRRAANYGSVWLGQSLRDWEWRVEVQGSSHRFDDDANTKRMSGYRLANLYGAYRIDREWSLFARVNNLFDRDYALADGYSTPGFNTFIGFRYQPR